MKRLVARALLVALVAGVCLPALGGGQALTPLASPAAVGTLAGNITGPTSIPTSGSATYFINASGYSKGLALSWTGAIVGGNTSGATLTPTSGTVIIGTPSRTVLKVGAVAQPVTIEVELKGGVLENNSTLNLSYTVQVEVPITLRATLVAGPSATVLPFTLEVDLDGAKVGTVSVPSLKPNAVYNLSYDYGGPALSPGWHVFTVSLAEEHGLVTFANGATALSSGFYIAQPPADVALWGVVGVVAFFGVLFISLTRVAARRRGAGRR